MSVNKINHAIHWIVIYTVDSVIHLSINPSQDLPHVVSKAWPLIATQACKHKHKIGLLLLLVPGDDLDIKSKQKFSETKETPSPLTAYFLPLYYKQRGDNTVHRTSNQTPPNDKKLKTKDSETISSRCAYPLSQAYWNIPMYALSLLATDQAVELKKKALL